MLPIVPDQGRAATPKVDRRTAWREVASLLGGEVLEGRRPSKDKVLVTHGPWTIWLDTYSVQAGEAQVTYTRVQAYFVGWRGLRVTARPRNVVDRLLQALGFGRRLSLGRALLEKRVVKGKPESRLPSLFMAAGLTDAVLAAPKATLKVSRPSRSLRKRHGEDLGVVMCRTSGVVRSANRLAAMIRVVAAGLDALSGIGEAREEEVPDRP